MLEISFESLGVKVNEHKYLMECSSPLFLGFRLSLSGFMSKKPILVVSISLVNYQKWAISWAA